jgi:hypothetical protein
MQLPISLPFNPVSWETSNAVRPRPSRWRTSAQVVALRTDGTPRTRATIEAAAAPVRREARRLSIAIIGRMPFRWSRSPASPLGSRRTIGRPPGCGNRDRSKPAWAALAYRARLYGMEERGVDPSVVR